jgi:sulfate transport system permease protein
MEIRNDKGIFKWFLIGACTLFLGVMLVLPLIYVIYTALREGFQTYVASVTDFYAVKAVLLTVKVVVIAVVINSVFGLFAAWLITKFRFRGKKIISTLIDLPLTISPIIAGLIYVLTFGRQSALYPYLQKWNIQIIFAVPGIVLATIFVTFPFISREIIPVLTAEGTDEEEAAALLGANGFQIFTQITFPHIKWAFLYGVVLCSARAMGEFGAVSVLSGHLRGITNTMPLYIELLYQAFDFTGAFAMSSILVIMAVAILIARNVLEYRGKKDAETESDAGTEKNKKKSYEQVDAVAAETV